jgi:hypothetical protein
VSGVKVRPSSRVQWRSSYRRGQESTPGSMFSVIRWVSIGRGDRRACGVVSEGGGTYGRMGTHYLG